MITVSANDSYGILQWQFGPSWFFYFFHNCPRLYISLSDKLCNKKFTKGPQEIYKYNDKALMYSDYLYIIVQATIVDLLDELYHDDCTRHYSVQYGTE